MRSERENYSEREREREWGKSHLPAAAEVAGHKRAVIAQFLNCGKKKCSLPTDRDVILVCLPIHGRGVFNPSTALGSSTHFLPSNVFIPHQ